MHNMVEELHFKIYREQIQIMVEGGRFEPLRDLLISNLAPQTIGPFRLLFFICFSISSQRQQDPTHHAEQKIKLQSSMMQELESHHQKESVQRTAVSRGSTETQSTRSSEKELLTNPTPKRTSARRSLDYSGFPASKAVSSNASVDHGPDESRGASDFIRGHDEDNVKHNVDDSVTQEIDTPESKKRVRIVSPTETLSPLIDGEPLVNGGRLEHLSNSPNAGPSEGTRTRHMSSPLSPSGRPSSAPARSRDLLRPSSAANQARMIQYLVDELRALLGSTGQ